MKFPFRKRRPSSGFTLVELLVVMGIIAILAGVIGVSVGSAIKYAKRTKSSSMATSIQTAVQNYYTEYGVYPTPSGFGDGATPTDAYYDGGSSSGWKDLITALCGDMNPASSPPTVLTPTPDLNTRKIAFFTPSRSDIDVAGSTGVPQNPFYTSGGTYPQFYYMIIDTDYSGIAGDTGSAPMIPDFSGTNVASGKAVVGGVIVWSPNDQPLTSSAANPSKSAFWSHTY